MTNTKMFPSDEDFARAEIQPAIKWADLPQGKYCIAEKKEVKTKYGDTLILTLTPYKDEKCLENILVWAPERLVQQLKEKPDARYIRNDGLKVSSKNKSHKFHSFVLL